MKSMLKIMDGAAESCATSLARQSVRRRCGPKRAFERKRIFPAAPAPAAVDRLTALQIHSLRAEYTVARKHLKGDGTFAKRECLNQLVLLLDRLLKEYERDELHEQFWKMAVDFVREHGAGV